MPRKVIVVGGGTAGLAIAWALARRGIATVVFERFRHVHDRGSHSGDTRLLRHAYHEGDVYVPLVQRSEGMWRELGRRTGQRLYEHTGVLEFGSADDTELSATLASCQRFGIEHELLDGSTASSRWPLSIPADWRACYTPSGGFIRIVPAMNALRDEARAAGAQLHYGARARVEAQGSNAVVVVGDAIHRADWIVVAAGAYLAQTIGAVVPKISEVVGVARRMQVWLEPGSPVTNLPVWLAFTPMGMFYGVPETSGGLPGSKIARHDDDGARIDPERLDDRLHPEDVEPIERFAGAYAPRLLGRLVGHRACMYTLSADQHFIVGRASELTNLVVCGGLSGHGFKFAPVLGELVAGLVCDGNPPPVEFSCARLGL